MESKGGKLGRDVTHLPPGQGKRSLWVLGELVAFKIASSQTGGAYSLFEVHTLPGSGVPTHVQHREDEAFFVLEGEYEFLVEGRTINAAAGSLIYVPKGNLHAHENVGKELGRMLVSQTPGGLHERFFQVIGEETKGTSIPPGSGDPADLESIAKIATEYGIEMPYLAGSYNRGDEVTQ